MASGGDPSVAANNGARGNVVVAAPQSIVTQVSQSAAAGTGTFLGSQTIPRPLFFKMEKYKRRLDRFRSTNPPHASDSVIVSSAGGSAPFSGNVSSSPSISAVGKAHSIGHIPSSSSPPNNVQNNVSLPPLAQPNTRVPTGSVNVSSVQAPSEKPTAEPLQVHVPFFKRMKRLLCCFGTGVGKLKQKKGDSGYVPAKILMTTTTSTANVNNSDNDDTKVGGNNNSDSVNNASVVVQKGQAQPIVKAPPQRKDEGKLPSNRIDTSVHSSLNDLNKSPYIPSFESKFLLKNLAKEDVGKKCLVLDLDETLIHSSFKPVPNPDFIIPVEIEGVVHSVYVLKRPHVDDFLKRLGSQFEVVIFTASLSKYADPVIDQLDIHKVVKHRLFRESCYNHRGAYVKDLSQLGRDLNSVMILDNAPGSYLFHPNNAIPVTSWFDDLEDHELLELIDLLEDLKKVPDVRAVLQDGNSILEDTNSNYSIS